MIRNTQIAKQMRLTVDKSIAAAFGGDLQFNKALKVAGDSKSTASTGGAKSATIVSAQEGGTFAIDETFGKPLTVCFLAQRFTLKSVAGGVSGTIVGAKLVNEYWNPSASPNP